MWALWVLFATLVVYVFYRASLRPSNFPPGPLVLPILGSTPFLFPSPKEAFQRFQKKYGDICSFNIFGRWGILISDPALIRATGTDYSYSGRPSLYIFISRNIIISGKDEPLGIIGTSGDVCKHQRRFTLRTLKDQGFGRNSIEPIMQSELQELGDYFASQSDKKLSVGNTFNRSVINVIWALVIGKRFTYDDARLQELVNKVNRMIQSFDPFMVALNFPIIKKLFPNLDIYKKTDGNTKDILQFIEDQITVYMKEMKEGNGDACYVGHYLKEIKESEETGKETPLSMHHLKANVFELFIAGSETTSSTLWWAIYHLTHNPKVQRKIQEETDRVIGPGKVPTLDHFDSLPYTTATIYEIQRISDLVPFAVPHELLEDRTIGPYRIEKGNHVLYNLSHVLKSPKYWKHPDTFYPEHFLTSDGKPFKPDVFLPFGYGKRVCLGESLARQELFLFLTNLIHRFSWKLSDDPVMWEKSTVVSRPPNFTVYVTQRRTVGEDMKKKD